MSLVSEIEGGAALEAMLKKSRVKCESREKAQALVRTIQRVESSIARSQAKSMYLGDDEKGQRAHKRVLVFLNPTRAVDWVEPFHTAPAIRDPRALVTYSVKQQHLVVDKGTPVLTPDGDPKIKVRVLDLPHMSKDEVVRAAVRSLIRERHEHGPDDIWAVYGVNCAGERCEMLLAGPLSRLRLYFPDSMTRQVLKRAGVAVKDLGNPYQIRRFGI